MRRIESILESMNLGDSQININISNPPILKGLKNINLQLNKKSEILAPPNFLF
jgi:hypothetical protein